MKNTIKIGTYHRVLLLVAAFVAVFFMFSARAEAWVDKRQDTFGYFKNQEKDSNFYYCDDVNKYPCKYTNGAILPMIYEGNTVAIPDHVDDADSFYKFLHDIYFDDNLELEPEAQKAMVAFLVHTLLGHDPGKPNSQSTTLKETDWVDLKNRLNNPDLTIERDQYYTAGSNVYHQGHARQGSVKSRQSNHDAAWLRDGGTTEEAIVFRHKGVKVYAIFVACANPDGSLPTSLPPAPSAGNFDFTPSVQLRLEPNVENPVSAVIKSKISVSNSPADVAVKAEASRRYYIKRNGSEVATLPSPAPEELILKDNHEFDESTVNINGIVQSGDEVCATVTVSPAQGTMTEDGDILVISENSRKSNETCQQVAYKPYFKVYGGDVLVGSAFGEDGTVSNCNPSEGLLIGWNSKITTGVDSGKYIGSGSQLAVYAIGKVTEFTSGNLLHPNKPRSLTYANDTPSNEYGGEWGPDFGQCANQFWKDGVPDPEDNIVLKPNTNSGDYHHDGNVTLSFNAGGEGTGLNKGKRITIYVDGNVSIKNDIKYKNQSYNSLEDITSFRLIVKGNIFVHPSVKRLDGLYVAIPKDENSGNLYTCSNGLFNPPSKSEFENGCRDNNLTLTGAVVAERVKLARTYGTLSQSSPGESFNNDEGQPAEKFIFSPEVWLTSDFSIGGDTAAMKSLPPGL